MSSDKARSAKDSSNPPSPTEDIFDDVDKSGFPEDDGKTAPWRDLNLDLDDDWEPARCKDIVLSLANALCPDEVALIDRWNEAIRGCESDLQEHELEAIQKFHNPQNLSEDLLKRLRSSAQDVQGNTIVAERWHILHQKFIKALNEIEDAVKYVQQLQESAKTNLALANPLSQPDFVKQLEDVDLSSARFPCHEIPHTVQHFLGRSTQIDDIILSLKAKQPHVLCTIIISGFAGMGKSSLVIEAAHQMVKTQNYESILWVNASSRDLIRESFNKIACRLRLDGSHEKSDKDLNYMLVKQWLDKTKRSWLLIYDNVDDSVVLDEYLPPETGSLIITTRYKALGFGLSISPKLIELTHLSEKDSLELFNKYRLMRDPNANVRGEKAETEELLEHIDFLTLGVKQMASYVGSKKLKIKDFKKKYDITAKNILDHQAPSTTHTLGTLWNVQFEDTKKSEDSFASDLLGLLSLCHADAIPHQLFELDDPLNDGNVAGFCQYIEDFERAEDELELKALIEVDRDKDEISIHRLTQQAFLYDANGLYETKALQASFDGLVSLLDRKFPRYGREKSLLYDWDTCSRYLSHVLALAKHFKASKRTKRKLESNELFVELLKNATWYLQEIGEIRDSEDLLEIAFEACEDKGSLTYAYLCNTKVVLAMDTNEIEKGHSYSQKAIAIREQKLAPADIDIAISHGNFANILVNEADFDEALKHMTIADNIWVGAGNTDDTYRALAYLNLGRVYSLKGLKKDVVTAENYFRKAEEVYSKSANNLFLIGVHYTWATMLMNNGDLLGALGKLEAALVQAEKSLPFKLVIAAILYKLAIVNFELGFPEKSKSLLKKAMPIAQYQKQEAFIGRLGRQLALIIEADPNATTEEKIEAKKLLNNAIEIKKRLWKSTGSRVKKIPKDEEDEWAWLVAAWYR
ncbi:hypothetical protein N0V90_001717 [Kalmusia sp. IMI 367209]|nr:hypothetical protein N0V90_001717 [Kalmusia sp. IMI 367209]